MMVGGWSHMYASDKRDLNNKLNEIKAQGYKITQVIPPCKCAKFYEVIYERWSGKPLEVE